MCALAVGREDLRHAAQQLRQDRAGVARAPISAPWAIARAASASVGPARPAMPSARCPAPAPGVPTSCAAKTASTAAAADSTVR
ncbi:hypothetical protein DN402_10730 [Streptomyces sp. SW4]|nr:hypothetical protein DN402_10730 [Streptomyces sp. SW4]